MRSVDILCFFPGLVNTLLLIIFMPLTLVSSFIALYCFRINRKQTKINEALSNDNREILRQKDDLDNKATELSELNKLKDRLITILAHDLRSPLCTLRGVFDLLKDESVTMDQMVKMVPGILKKLEYTADFLDTLLGWINSQMENFGNSAVSFSLKDLITAELAHYEDQAKSKGILLKQCVPNGARAWADPTSIKIVVRNLITNALKFSKVGDTIRISAQLENNDHLSQPCYIVSVEDTGTGMSDQQLKRLFKEKVNSGTGTNNETGTGMAMMFCKDLVEKCGGEIWVTSKVDMGTQFYFSVPIHLEDKSGNRYPELEKSKEQKPARIRSVEPKRVSSLHFFKVACLMVSGMAFFNLNAWADLPFRAKVDSLKQIVFRDMASGMAYRDTLAIDRINELAEKLIAVSADSSLYYGHKGAELSRKLNYQPGVANALFQTGHASYILGNYKQAKLDFDRAILIYQKLNDIKHVSDCYVSFGKMYTLQGDYKTALFNLNLALDSYDRESNKTEIANCYKDIGIVYFNQCKYAIALDYYYKALFVDGKELDKNATADIYNNIGNILQNIDVLPKSMEYYQEALKIAKGKEDTEDIARSEKNIGEALLANQNYEQAIDHLTKSMIVAQGQGNKDRISYLSADLGVCYGYKNQFTIAMSYLDTAMAIAEKYNLAYNKAFCLVGFATMYNLQKDYPNAEKYATLAQNQASLLGNNLWFRINAVSELHKAMAGLNKFNEAYNLSRQYIGLKDSMNNNESIQKLTSYNLEYDFETKRHDLIKQQREKDELNAQKLKQQTINFLFILALLIMLSISVIYYRGKRRQQKINNFLNNQAQKLHDSNNLKDRLIAILAHDLRAPLCTLKGIFGLFEDNSITFEEFLEMLPTAAKKLDYTSDFLDTLLFWINAQMENFESKAQVFSIKQVVTKEITSFLDQATEKGIGLTFDIPADFEVVAEKDTITIVVRNLLTNALKFSGKNDHVSVSVSHLDDGHVLVSVKDTGVGIPEAQLNKLFKNKVDSALGTGNESGTGMGLYFCQDLVEKCGGKIWAKSAENGGAQFFFTLPSVDRLDLTELQIEVANN